MAFAPLSTRYTYAQLPSGQVVPGFYAEHVRKARARSVSSAERAQTFRSQSSIAPASTFSAHTTSRRSQSARDSAISDSDGFSYRRLSGGDVSQGPVVAPMEDKARSRRVSFAKADEGTGDRARSLSAAKGLGVSRSSSVLGGAPVLSSLSLSAWDSREAESMHLPNGTYVGGVKNGKPHGQGTLTYYADDEFGRKSYTGQFSEGLRHGRGYMIWVNNRTYDGNWKDDKRDGVGKEEWANEEGVIEKTYFGYFANDKHHGDGRMTWSNGDYYRGAFTEGQITGMGSEQHTTQDHDIIIRVGEFRNGRLWNGSSTSVCEGEFVEGVAQGATCMDILCCLTIKA